MGKAKQAILNRHPALAEAFGTGIGDLLMHREREVQLAVLEELRRRDIIGLGLHDGLLVPSARSTDCWFMLDHRGVGGAAQGVEVNQ